MRLAFLSFWLPPVALACSCTRADQLPACAVFHEYAYIFRARMVANCNPLTWDCPGARLEVEEVYKGLTPHIRQVFLARLGGDCESRLPEKGNSLLIYNPAPLDVTRGIPVFLAEGLCAPSRQVKPDDPDLAYLRQAARRTYAGPGTIQGHVVQNHELHVSIEEFAPVAGALVTAAANSRHWQTRTAPDGSFRLRNLPPGHYDIKVSAIGFGADLMRPATADFEVPAGGCLVADGFLSKARVVSGVAVDADGRPAAKLIVNLAWVNDDGSLRRLGYLAQTVTDEAGRFTFSQAPLGKLVVGVNLHRQPTADIPYPRTLTEVAADSGVTLRLPKPVPLASVEVEVVWPDRTPVQGDATVYALQEGESVASERLSAKTGRVRLVVPNGNGYTFQAYVFYGQGRSLEGATAAPVLVTRPGQRVTLRMKDPRPIP